MLEIGDSLVFHCYLMGYLGRVFFFFNLGWFPKATKNTCNPPSLTTQTVGSIGLSETLMSPQISSRHGRSIITQRASEKPPLTSQAGVSGCLLCVQRHQAPSIIALVKLTTFAHLPDSPLSWAFRCRRKDSLCHPNPTMPGTVPGIQQSAHSCSLTC